MDIKVATMHFAFLLYSPLNQGLKHLQDQPLSLLVGVFTLQSIKSRIETPALLKGLKGNFAFLLYSPLNQGLKQSGGQNTRNNPPVFTLQSIKSRIETSTTSIPRYQILVFTLQSIKSRIETRFHYPY